MIVNLKEILALAEEGGYAIPAFNVYNMETVMGVTAAAEELRAPVILQCYSRLFDGDEGYYVAPVIRAAAQKAAVPVCFHLDHGAGEAEVMRGVRYGCTGIMLDVSNAPFEENAARTANVSKLCGEAGIPVEGELGHIGSVNDAEMASYTEPDEAQRFVEQTGVAALAVMVGTAHGRYKKAPELDIERIRAIKAATGIPLVLHGGSGVPDDQIRAAIEAGIRKINFGTDLCYSFLDQVFETSRDKIAIDLFMKEPIQNVKRFAGSKMKLLGADGRICVK